MRISSVLVIGTLVMAVPGAFSVSAFAQQKPAASSSTAGKQQQKKQASAPAPAPAPAPAAQANPFPEAESSAAAAKANAASQNQSRLDVSSSHVDLQRFSAGANRDARISNGAGGYIHDPQLARQDDKVGQFYLGTHDYKGAYARYLEATRVAPGDANAVFGLAQAARGLGQTETAEANYLLYLNALPNGKHAKDARKALKSIEKAHGKK